MWPALLNAFSVKYSLTCSKFSEYFWNRDVFLDRYHPCHVRESAIATRCRVTAAFSMVMVSVDFLCGVVWGYFRGRLSIAPNYLCGWSGSGWKRDPATGLGAAKFNPETPELVWEQLFGHVSFGLGAAGTRPELGRNWSEDIACTA